MRLRGLPVLALLALLAALPSPASAEPPKGLAAGVVVELPVQNPVNKDLVLIISGDGGWADLDRELGKRMRKRGTAVIGFDALKYFWKARTPEETSRDIAAILTHYMQAWNKDRVVLVGFSFGAAALPFVVNRLPEELRDKVAIGVMLGSNTYANWEIHVRDWLDDMPHKGARDVAPEVAQVKDTRLVCVYGEEEAENSVCTILPQNRVEVIKTKGGHHFDENYEKLADMILTRADAPAQARSQE